MLGLHPAAAERLRIGDCEWRAVSLELGRPTDEGLGFRG